MSLDNVVEDGRYTPSERETRLVIENYGAKEGPTVDYVASLLDSVESIRNFGIREIKSITRTAHELFIKDPIKYAPFVERIMEYHEDGFWLIDGWEDHPEQRSMIGCPERATTREIMHAYMLLHYASLCTQAYEIRINRGILDTSLAHAARESFYEAMNRFGKKRHPDVINPQRKVESLKAMGHLAIVMIAHENNSFGRKKSLAKEGIRHLRNAKALMEGEARTFYQGAHYFRGICICDNMIDHLRTIGLNKPRSPIDCARSIRYSKIHRKQGIGQ